jgi:hypothetical protein
VQVYTEDLTRDPLPVSHGVHEGLTPVLSYSSSDDLAWFEGGDGICGGAGEYENNRQVKPEP